MALTLKMSALDRALTTARAQYQAAIERAEHILEARQNEHYETTNRSSKRVADLVSNLEFLEAFERDRDAARTRLELHSAELAHRANVESADRVLATAIDHYVSSVAMSAVALAASVKAAAGAA